MEEPFIQTEHLSRTYLREKLETTAVRNATLEISRGEFVAVMGPSGCGKTSLLNLLGLIDRPTSGSYVFKGVPVNGMSEAQLTRLRRGNMGFIFQNYNLVDELTVLENVELPLVFMGVKRKARRNRASEILHTLKLSHRSSHYPQQLSGGQQQRVAFARAIVNQPPLILADEPTGNLDSRNSAMLLDLLDQHNRKGGTIIMVTHSPKDASYAHRVLNLLDGELIN